MKRERNIITIDEYGKVAMPTDIGATAMTEWEICGLFGITAPTFRAGIKALCKSGVLKEYEIKRTIRISDKSNEDVYNLETITTPLSTLAHTERDKSAKPCWIGQRTDEKRKRPFSFHCSRMANPTAVGKHDDISTSKHIIM